MFFFRDSICLCFDFLSFLVDDFLDLLDLQVAERYRAVSHRSQDQSTEDDEEIENFKLPEECGLETRILTYSNF